MVFFLFHIQAYFNRNIVVFNGMQGRNPGLHLRINSPFSVAPKSILITNHNAITKQSQPTETMSTATDLTSLPPHTLSSSSFDIKTAVHHFRNLLTSPTVIVDFPCQHVAKPVRPSTVKPIVDSIFYI